MSLDPSLLIGSLELDGQVNLKRRVEAYSQMVNRSDAEREAFETGYLAAYDVLIAASRRLLSEGIVTQPGTPPLRPVPPETKTEHRKVPEGWLISDTNADSLRKLILDKAQGAKAPTLIFDLDGTLVDVSYRTLGIYKSWLSSLGSGRYPEELVHKLSGISLMHVGYSLSHAFENAGLDLRDEAVAEAFESAESYWRRHFFDGRSLVEFDRTLPGAPAFVQGLCAEGLQVVYLTGRSAKNMEEGTRTQLRALGFPLDGIRLFMKTNPKQSDHAFKEETVKMLSQDSDVIANFENEYINLHTMMAYLTPGCLHVLVDTQHSGRPVPPNPRAIYRIRDYLEALHRGNLTEPDHLKP